MSVSSASQASSSAYTKGYVIAGKYELEAELGGGGMGVVFRAKNLALDAPVAIKLIRTDLSRQMLGDRLLQEARAAARLGHPSIVRVFDVGRTEDGDPFLVMEFLKGNSLGALLQAGPLEATRAVQLLLPIADALSLAHAKGFVHRDLKPDNIFIAEDDDQLQPKLLDFGIVKMETHDGGGKLTQCGTVLGSPDYMSPEQARGAEDIDYRSDIWSFCVTLYQAVSGHLPFEGSNYNALLRHIVEELPFPLAKNECELELWQIIQRGLEKERDQRYRSMGELGRALSDWLLSKGVLEDACGKSLESKWRRMPSDPKMRASIPSFADDSASFPRSGVHGTDLPPTRIDPDGAAQIEALDPTTQQPIVFVDASAQESTLRVRKWAIALGALVGTLVLAALILRKGPASQVETPPVRAAAAPAAAPEHEPRSSVTPLKSEAPAEDMQAANSENVTSESDREQSAPEPAAASTSRDVHKVEPAKVSQRFANSRTLSTRKSEQKREAPITTEPVSAAPAASSAKTAPVSEDPALELIKAY